MLHLVKGKISNNFNNSNISLKKFFHNNNKSPTPRPETVVEQ